MTAVTAAGAGRDPVKYLLIAGISLFWGLNWPAVKTILTQVPIFSLRAIGFTAGAVLLLGAARLAGHRLRVERAEWPALAAGGLCNVLVFNLCTALGQSLMATSQAAIIAFTMPVWATLLAIPLLGERPALRQILGLACGLGGLLVLLGPEALTAPPSALAGPAIMLVAAVAWALGTIVMKRRVWRSHPMVITGWQYVICALPMIVLATAEARPAVADIHAAVWVGFAWHILCSICAAQALWYVTVRRLTVGEAAVSTLLIPVVGVGGAVLLLGDPVTPRLAAALLLVLAAVACALGPKPAGR
ncbi:DMT family transporter [Azospirillum picis]|uniref:Drug/metabolite transporter (DMT)-like permease n=1 Tax=Azospirillum picis TaxID=488438 RepID=A0ABU0MIB1_9PROT|nr:DMT family transporter [Azospirillum picis]MBP2299161.1 drug/metabolite transporter (DMT)-like permease [Azospirillum picis]MDQ0533201.1 drug/metabolite transporter (DMT)-like permease [Azospirillum picis]